MTRTLPKIVETFAKSVVTQKFDQAYECLAKPLKASLNLADFKQMMKDAEEDVVPPKAFDMDANSCSFEDIKTSEYRGNINADEGVLSKLDPKDFKQWLCIQFTPDPEDAECDLDACYDFWCMIVAEGNEEKIGFFEIHDPD
jgi:hypothetical protein